MFNKTKTQTFQVAELMLEDDESFEEAANDVELPLKQRETLINLATKARMPIKDYLVHISFYDKYPIIGRVARWWFEKTFVDQFLTILLYLAIFSAFTASIIIHDESAKEKYKGFGHLIEQRRPQQQ